MEELPADDSKRLDILQAAERLIARQGFAKTSIKEIASGANVALGTIYANFGNKLGVLEALVEHRVADMVRKMAALRADDPVSRFVDGVRLVNRTLAKDPFLRNLISQAPDLHEPRLVDRGRKLVAVFDQLGKAALDDAIQRGYLTCADPEALIVLIRCATVGWLQHEMLGPDPLDHERMIEGLLGFVEAARRAPPANARRRRTQ